MTESEKLIWRSNLPAGWHALLDRVVTDIAKQDRGATIEQAKSKFGHSGQPGDNGGEVAIRAIAIAKFLRGRLGIADECRPDRSVQIVHVMLPSRSALRPDVLRG